MIDIHTHILPGVDDGCPDLFDSILLAELAVESGVRTVIATPHSHSIPDSREHMRRILDAYQTLRREIEDRGIPLELLLGMEILCWDDFEDRFREGTVLPLNGTEFYLIEFDFEVPQDRIRQAIETVRSHGGRPVIAHPERYTCLQRDISLAGTWVDLGSQLQMNKGSAFGAFGRSARRTSLKLLKSGLYTYAASDAHSPYGRTTQMDGLRDFLEKTVSPDAAETLLIRNAEQYLLHRA